MIGNIVRVADLRHHEFLAMEAQWARLLDAFEGGAAYRDRIYGQDLAGHPIRNLYRHRRDSPPTYTNGTDPYARDGAGEDYELRRSRTPVPRFTHSAVFKHVSRIFSEEIRRKGPPSYEAWCEDADGTGEPVGDWIRNEVAPLFLLLGTLDVLVDAPSPGDGAAVESQADVTARRLDTAVASVVLPTNVPWWKLGDDGLYERVLVVEWHDDDTGKQERRLRLWTRGDSQLYGEDSKPIGPPRPHPYGVVPIRRFLVGRRPRRKCVGLSIYEGIADQEREFYNTDSEIVLANSLQAHPILQGPHDAFGAGGEVVVSPSWVLAQGTDGNGNAVAWEYLSPPKEPFTALRTSNLDRVDRMNDLAALVKPAGTAVGNGTAGQSGISKMLDQDMGNDLLVWLGSRLADLERGVGRLASLVATGGREAAADVEVIYPKGYSLYSAQEVADLGVQSQAYMEGCGKLPELEKATLKALAAKLAAGADEATIAAINADIDAFVEGRAADSAALRESGIAPATANGSPDAPTSGGGGDDTEDDPEQAAA